MHVCILEEFTRLGGGQVYALQLANALTTLGHSVVFVVAGEPRVGVGYPVKVVDVGFRASYDLPSLIMNYINHRRLRRILSDYLEDCDLAINNHPNFIPHAGGPIVLHGLSFVDFIIDEWGNVKNKLLFEVLSRIYRMYNGSFMIYNSRYTMNLAKALLPRMRIQPSGEYILSPHYTISTEDIPQKEDYVLTVGRLEWNKGLRALMKVAREVRRRIVVIGRTDTKESKEVLKTLRTISNVEVIPDADEKTKQEYYRHASIYLHFRRNENFGIAVLDAVATATIPITPRSGGPWTDILEEGKYGLGYNTIEEIPRLIENAEKLIDREKIHKSKERYSPTAFKNKTAKLLMTYSNRE